MKKRSLFEHLFWSPNYFTIAIHKRNEQEAPLWERKSFKPDYVMPATRGYWVADPMPVKNGDKTYLFYEAAHHNKGRIEVVEIQNDGTTSQPKVALERQYHLSYPFVFKHRGEWYMIPESCAINEVQLLRATHFPTEWEYVKTLLKEYAVDTTVKDYNGRLLMLTYVPEPGSENVTPRAFWMDWENDIVLREIAWRNYDPLQVRGAGSIVVRQGRYIRPAQINQKTSYGDGVLFAECCCFDSAYSEKELGCLLGDDLQVSGWKADGLHTYAETDQFEVIDIRCQLPDLWKAPRSLLNILRKTRR